MGVAEAEAYDAWADYYDLADADRAPFVAFYAGLLDARAQTLLELGCGTGSILSALVGRLHGDHGLEPRRVVGVDASAGMLRIARARHPGIEWILGDICEPGVKGHFGLVTSCFNTLQHLLADEDLVAALRAARALLADDGRFAFDVYQPNVPYLSIEAHDRVARRLVDAQGRTLEIREDARYDADTRLLSLRWRLIDANEPEAPPLAATGYRLRQYFAADVERAITTAGLV
ncbi:MAG: class I SAM-dependent methyltransferase, partial [Arenimonas sp.]